MSTAIKRYLKENPEKVDNLTTKEELRLRKEPTMDDFILYGIFHENSCFFPDYDALLDAYSWELKFYNDNFKKRVIALANKINDDWLANQKLPDDFYDTLIPARNCYRRCGVTDALAKMDEKNEEQPNE